MKVIKPAFVVESEVCGSKMLENIERYGRTCYKSEEKISLDSAAKFVKNILAAGHESVIEHEKITVRVICDRGVSHEIVRHRIAAYSQESTRYCDYGKTGEIVVIEPCFWQPDSQAYAVWKTAMEDCEKAYNALRKLSASPQEARSVLPNSLKTEIVITYNLREWRHFFKLRCNKRAHPQMREITVPLLREFKRLLPIVFDDLSEE